MRPEAFQPSFQSYGIITVFPFSLSHHKAAGDLWLKDFVKRTLRETAVVEGEEFGYVARAMLVMSAALQRETALRVVEVRFILHGAR